MHKKRGHLWKSLKINGNEPQVLEGKENHEIAMGIKENNDVGNDHKDDFVGHPEWG